MADTSYDVIVVGCGAMGAATLYQLAKRGKRVLGIDRFAPPHRFGSSHGDTRITRLGIGEGPHFTPFSLRSHAIWRDIERDTGRTLLTRTGGLVIAGTRAAPMHVSGFFENTIAAAKSYGIQHEIIEPADLRRRFPALALRDGESGYYEYEAGYLGPEACIETQLALALKHGADVLTSLSVLALEGNTVITESRRFSAEHVVLSAGPWLPDILGGALSKIFRVFRQVMFWFDIEGALESYLPGRFPIFIWQIEGAAQGIYGFPAIDGPLGGIKIAGEQYDVTTAADELLRHVSEDEIAHMFETYVAPYLKGVSPRCLRAEPCLYTVTPDAGFVIDAMPGRAGVLVVSACSGHGFKHSAAIGEAVAEQIVEGRSKLDLSRFRLDRFKQTGTSSPLP